MRQNATDAGSPSEWQRLEPHLDEAIHTLGAIDQDVIALRFLEGKSLRETGQSLSMTEDAVQKRASRALAKLRDFFARRGFRLSAAALATLLAANTEAGIPPWLSGAVTRRALAAAASSAGITLTLMKIIAHLTTRLSSGVSVAVVVVAAVVLTEHASPDNAAARDRSASPAEPAAEATPQPARARYRPAPLRANEPSAPAPAPAQAETGWVIFEGYVVDDLTGQPVTDYALEFGSPDSSRSGETSWGFGRRTVHQPAGRFEASYCVKTGGRLWLRVLAAGYLPQPVTPEPVTVPTEITKLVVRLNRGGTLRGVVLDHAGQPVAGAHVLLTGNQTLNLRDGIAEDITRSTATTDAEGRFGLSGVEGAEQNLVVVSDIVQVWSVPITEPGQEMKIVLPEPATLVVHYDIPGDTEQAQLWLQFRSVVVAYVTQPFVTNGGQIVLTNLAPGTYDFYRSKGLLVAGQVGGAACDHATLVLQSGQVQDVDWVRATGFPVAGEVTGLQDAGFSAVFIYVRPAKTTGAIMDAAEGKLPFYDAAACGPDGIPDSPIVAGHLHARGASLSARRRN